MSDVKVIAQRYADRQKTDPSKRLFRIAEHVVENPEKMQGKQMYVGDRFRATVITLMPGQEQPVHVHPATDHAWFVVSGNGVVTMEDGRTERIEPGIFGVHLRDSVHGIRNDGSETLVYIALSTGD